MEILETKRLMIRGFSQEDWKDLYEYLSKEEVVKYEPYGVLNEKQCRKEASNRSKSEIFLAVCLKGSNKLIGNIYFDKQEPEDFLTWELGYVFNPNYYGNGYATEACKAVMDYAFKQMNTRRIIAMCNPENKASWSLLERLGLRREGHLIKNIFFKYDDKGNPIWNDTYEYAILKEEWS